MSDSENVSVAFSSGDESTDESIQRYDDYEESNAVSAHEAYNSIISLLSFKKTENKNDAGTLSRMSDLFNEFQDHHLSFKSRIAKIADLLSIEFYLNTFYSIFSLSNKKSSYKTPVFKKPVERLSVIGLLDYNVLPDQEIIFSFLFHEHVDWARSVYESNNPFFISTSFSEVDVGRNLKEYRSSKNVDHENNRFVTYVGTLMCFIKPEYEFMKLGRNKFRARGIERVVAYINKSEVANFFYNENPLDLIHNVEYKLWPINYNENICAHLNSNALRKNNVKFANNDNNILVKKTIKKLKLNNNNFEKNYNIGLRSLIVHILSNCLINEDTRLDAYKIQKGINMLRFLNLHLNNFDISCLGCSTAIGTYEKNHKILDKVWLNNKLATGFYFTNPSGTLYQLTLMSSASSVSPLRTPEFNDSWFLGYGWNTLACSNCGSFLGWKFTRGCSSLDKLFTPDDLPEFYGLITNHLKF